MTLRAVTVALGWLAVAAEARAQAAPVAVEAPAETAPTPAPPAETVSTPAPPAETLPTPAPTPYAGATPAPAPFTSGAAKSPAPYPTPGAPPSKPTGFDLGGQQMTPLPPPPPPLDASRIRHEPWRGRWWIGLRAGITGPIGGDVPARPNLLTLGGGFDVGWRINNVIGLGMGLSGAIHNRVVVALDPGDPLKTQLTGRMLYWDALFARFHLPVKRRFQPYIEAGGGLARLARADIGASGKSFGGQLRGAIGFDGWVSRTITIGVSAVYRLNALRDPVGGGWSVGHALQGIVELGLHW
jgi:hypothetical protein